MVEVVLGIFWVAGDLAELSDIREGDYQIPSAGFKVGAENACIFRCKLIFMWVRQASVAVAGAHILNAAKVRSDSRFAIGADGVNRIWQCSFFAGEDVEYMTDKPVELPVVPDDFIFRAGKPLEHTTLLPAPRTAFAQFCPVVVIFQIHHADFDSVVGFWAAVLEVNFHPERVPAGRVEL